MSHPELIAHRGASRERRENTLAAFTRALELGAAGIELDVHASADGHVVVHHDAMLRSGRRIVQNSLHDLRTEPLPDGSTLPTLDEVLTLVGAAATVYVEIKAPQIEQAVADVLARHPTRTEVHSFDHRIVHRYREIDPARRTGALSSSYPIDPVQPLLAARAETLWQYCELIDEALVSIVHEAGARLIAWTVNSEHVAERLATIGVDGLCGDDVTMLQRVVGG